MTSYVDPEELPFTRAELYAAGCQFLTAEEAILMADHLSHLGPDAIRTRAQRRVQWRKGGLPNAESMLLCYWMYPVELLPALAGLSEDAASRVAVLSRRLDDRDSDRAV